MSCKLAARPKASARVMPRRESKAVEKSAQVPTPKPGSRVDANPVIYVISDSTGNLARHMLTAFLTQFSAGALTAHFSAFVRTEARLHAILEKAKNDRAIVCHAMVSPAYKQEIARFCDLAKLPCRD